MKKYRIENIIGNFGIFVDDEVEAEDAVEAQVIICEEIMENLANYLDIELEEIEDNSEEDDEYDYYDEYKERKMEEEGIYI